MKKEDKGEICFELIDNQVFVSLDDITEFLRELGAPKRIIAHLESTHERAYDELIRHN